MRLLLDEMHALGVAVDLRSRGYDAVAVRQRPELIGLADHEVLAVATKEAHAVVTENVKDFAALAKRYAATGDRHAGLVFTHPRRFPRAARNHLRVLSEALGRFVDDHAFTLQDAESFIWWLERPSR